MPLYVVTHAPELSPEQQASIAQSITRIHTTLFTTPSLFVNVRFSSAQHHLAFVGGRERKGNTIEAHVRHGPSRTRDHYDRLTKSIADAWAELVPQEPDLRIFILGDIVAGYEHGFAIPPPGGDVEWMRQHFDDFKKKADLGNEDMKQLVREIQEKGLLDVESGQS